jgi:hypothetical protein
MASGANGSLGELVALVERLRASGATSVCVSADSVAVTWAAPPAVSSKPRQERPETDDERKARENAERESTLWWSA